jgi:hypothetical protein
MTTARSLAYASTLVAACLLVAAPASADPVELQMTSTNPNVVLYKVKEEASVTVTGTAGTATGSAMSYELVCPVPCTKTVERDAKYFVAGDGVTGSSPFLLPAADRSKLVVDAGHRAPHLLGAFGVAFGIVGTAVGVPLGLAGDGSLSTTGWAMAGTAGVLLVGGIVLIATNGTDVKTTEGVVLAKGETGKPKVALTARGLSF